jgi:glycosyltransferase involved in cell wall biosynthesis
MKTVDIVIPVYNGEKELKNSIKTIISFLRKINFPYKWKIIISDNVSTDNTPKIAKVLSKEYKNVEYLFIPKKGRGIALRTAWMKSKAEIVSFMDVDLSVELEAFPRMVSKIAEGSDICIGSRFLKESKVKRSLKREIFSRSYNFLLKLLFQNKFTDAQCGFKAFNTEAVKRILPFVNDDEWFFDTELLVLAERKKYKISEIPFTWTEGKSTTVKLIKTSIKLLKKAIKLRFQFLNPFL